MKVKFVSEEGLRLDEDGGRVFATREHAARDAIRALSEWLVDQKLSDLPGTYGVLGLDEKDTPRFRVYMTVGMDTFPPSDPTYQQPFNPTEPPSDDDGGRCQAL